jgi:hypothetical protein
MDLPTQMASFKATQAALVDRQKQASSLNAYESTALKNLDVFLKQAEKVVDTGSPYLNTPLRKMSDRLLGSPQMASFNAARQVVLPEFARIITNPNLTGVLSNQVRDEISSLIKGDATLKQIVAVSKVLKQDAENRKTSLQDEIDALTRQIAKPPKMRGTGGDTGGGAGAMVPMRTPSGDIRLIPADQVKDAESRGAKRLTP